MNHWDTEQSAGAGAVAETILRPDRLLRVSLGLVYLWFGILRVVGMSPWWRWSEPRIRSWRRSRCIGCWIRLRDDQQSEFFIDLAPRSVRPVTARSARWTRESKCGGCKDTMRVPVSQDRFLSYTSLFTSFGTLVCCALPSVLVLIGLGATVASFLTAVPWLVTLSRNKEWVFAISGSLIALNFVYVYWLAPRLRAAGEACPIDEPTACSTADKVSRVTLWTSAAIYLVGFFAAFILGPLLVRFG